jgi:hypothetical protein
MDIVRTDSITSTHSTVSTCDICFYSKDDMFDIMCCRNNFICKECHNLLRHRECPFCRQEYKEQDQGKNKSINRRRSHSIHIEPISTLDYDIDMESFDDILTTNYYSRIYRRKRKRILKLREQESNRKKNRELRMIAIDQKLRENRKEKKN